MAARKQNRPRYRVGQTVEFGGSWQTKPGVGVVTWVTEYLGNVLTDGRPSFLYRVEVDNGYSVFGNGTKFVFEYQVKRAIATAKKAQAA